MSVKLRLARGGAKKRPFYSIVAADPRSPRDGRFIERVGTYNPMVERDHAERLVLKEERVRYWLEQGAQPTERVERLLGQAGIVPVPEISVRPQKSAPGKKAQERAREAAAAKEAAKEAAAAPAAPAAEAAPAEEAAAEA